MGSNLGASKGFLKRDLRLSEQSSCHRIYAFHKCALNFLIASCVCLADLPQIFKNYLDLDSAVSWLEVYSSHFKKAFAKPV